jgi:hypothetical protein
MCWQSEHLPQSTLLHRLRETTYWVSSQLQSIVLLMLIREHSLPLLLSSVLNCSNINYQGDLASIFKIHCSPKLDRSKFNLSQRMISIWPSLTVQSIRARPRFKEGLFKYWKVQRRLISWRDRLHQTMCFTMNTHLKQLPARDTSGIKRMSLWWLA